MKGRLANLDSLVCVRITATTRLIGLTRITSRTNANTIYIAVTRRSSPCLIRPKRRLLFIPRPLSRTKSARDHDSGSRFSSQFGISSLRGAQFTFELSPCGCSLLYHWASRRIIHGCDVAKLACRACHPMDRFRRRSCRLALSFRFPIRGD
jgi:hypothetical protein